MSKLPPAQVRTYLSRDVEAILTMCRTQFKDDGYEEECFDIDAVMQGRSVVRTKYEAKVTPAAWAQSPALMGSNRPLARPTRGNFIPNLRIST